MIAFRACRASRTIFFPLCLLARVMMTALIFGGVGLASVGLE